MAVIVVDYDTDAGARYVELPGYDESQADHVVEVIRDLLTVDVDASDRPIGVELLRAPAEVDEMMLHALAERFPALQMPELRAALAGQRLTAAK